MSMVIFIFHFFIIVPLFNSSTWFLSEWQVSSGQRLCVCHSFWTRLSSPVVMKFVECHNVYIPLFYQQCFKSANTIISPLRSSQLVKDLIKIRMQFYSLKIPLKNDCCSTISNNKQKLNLCNVIFIKCWMASWSVWASIKKNTTDWVT